MLRRILKKKEVPVHVKCFHKKNFIAAGDNPEDRVPNQSAGRSKRDVRIFAFQFYLHEEVRFQTNCSLPKVSMKASSLLILNVLSKIDLQKKCSRSDARLSFMGQYSKRRYVNIYTQGRRSHLKREGAPLYILLTNGGRGQRQRLEK